MMRFWLGAVLVLITGACESTTGEETPENDLCNLAVGITQPISRVPVTPELTVQGLTPTSALLEGSPFADADVGDTHGATDWQVDEERGDWLSPVASCVSSTHLTSWQATGLEPSTKYWSRLRYRDEGGSWSGFAPPMVILTPATPGGDLAWVAVSAGQDSSCGIVTGGRAFCWGAGAFPGNNEGNARSSPHPVPLEPSKRFASVDAGMQQTCAVTTDGFAQCWGMFPRPGSDRFTMARAGANYACGLDGDGAAFCWGADWGQLGLGSSHGGAGVPDPTRVVGGLTFREIYPGDGVTCGITREARGYCWGQDVGGSLGSGSEHEGSVVSPVPIDGNRSWKKIEPRGNTTFGLDTDGRAFVWGVWPVGASDPPNIFTPKPLATDLRFLDVAAGYAFGCGVAVDHRAYCWGPPYSGAYHIRTEPPLVPAGGTHLYQSISARDRHVCALTLGGDIYCWGQNSSGQLGNGTYSWGGLTPVRVLRQR